MSDHIPMTRRDLLQIVGKVGGAGALYETMVALGLISVPRAWAGMPDLSGCNGAGQKVLVLGAGIGGLTSAYLLSGCGYECHILESTPRAGGRNRTARHGSEIVERIGNETVTQPCKFDADLYLNLGPGRLPYHHRRVLDFCQALDVKLEPYVMNTTGNLVVTDSDSQEPYKALYRHVQNDTRGYLSELLAKAVNKGSLDDELKDGDIDKEKLFSLIMKFGQVKTHSINEGPVYFYEGSRRDGCVRGTPNVHRHCEWYEDEKTATPPLKRKDLFESSFWDHGVYNPFEIVWQATLFQPVGGMDKIVEGFMRAFEANDKVQVTLDARVVEIVAPEDGNKVAVKYERGGAVQEEEADYCVSNIPLSILRKLDLAGIEGDYRTALEHPKFANSCKVGWQSNARFWESNDNQIYGGISWTDHMIEQIWYPSNDYFSEKGTLTGAYIHDHPDRPSAKKFGEYWPSKRLEVARAGAKQLHEEFGDESIVPTELGLSIAWQNVPSQQGAWADWKQEESDHYRRLLSPYGRFYVVGDQVSTLPGWQEGAMMSAEHVVRMITGIKRDELPADITAPDAYAVTQTG